MGPSFYVKGDEVMNPYQQSQQDIQKQLQQLMSATGAPTEIHVTKVNGRAGAEAYNMPPNSDDLLLDMNDPIIWFVQTDGAGYKTAIPYDISIHTEVKQEDIIKSIDERLSRLEEAINNGKPNTSAYTKQHKPGNVGNDASSRSNDKG